MGQRARFPGCEALSRESAAASCVPLGEAAGVPETFGDCDSPAMHTLQRPLLLEEGEVSPDGHARDPQASSEVGGIQGTPQGQFAKDAILSFLAHHRLTLRIV